MYDDERLNDSQHQLWKQREIVTLYIPVHDTEKAGLGVSVKGKTSGGGGGSPASDLGIFIKNVLHGGAASRDGRLRTNDKKGNYDAKNEKEKRRRRRRESDR
ncbi:hypothetical protein LSTR_LSTR015748 [Laodelphax striatellus]|uniref:PDZ domain-containing protein n=1 Tax=Laodelphax striatellus TaxID=195883 RepID=A0A482WYB3_LAOST|nr:hypothetical protein LSTR_LSTR015748 [Laodelphax striatellus]